MTPDVSFEEVLSSLCVPAAPGLQPLHESGKLEGMLAKAESKQKMLETHLF